MILKRINTNPEFIQSEKYIEKESHVINKKIKKEFIFIKANQSLIKIKYSEIIYIEGLKDYVKVYAGDKPLITKCTIKYLEQNLPLNDFIRIHKSYIVSVSKIVKIEFNHVFLHKKQIPIGQLYKEPFLNLIDNYSL